MKVKVLVFPCGSEIGLELHRSLSWSTHVELYGASSVSSNHGKYVYKNYIESLPNIEDDGFIDQFNSVIKKYNIDFIYPAHDSVVLKLSRHMEQLNGKVIGSSSETCNICRSKKLTYQVFENLINVPRQLDIADPNLQFPLFMKPDVGQGSKGARIIKTEYEAKFYFEKDNSMLLLEYLPGEEYTVDCFTDRVGNLRFVGARERIRMTNGISSDTRLIYDNEFVKTAERINNRLILRGGWFFQVKRDFQGKLTLLEIAPRISGSMGLFRNLGVNIPLLSIYDAMDLDVSVMPNNFDIRMDRALSNRFKIGIDYEQVYIDFDDCLVIDGRVNTLLMCFIYQCINHNIKVHLLTRNIGDMSAALLKHRMSGVFDSIQQVKSGEPKSLYIKSKRSIFIDDSFSERMEVYTNVGIPVFDLSSVECLINELK